MQRHTTTAQGENAQSGNTSNCSNNYNNKSPVTSSLKIHIADIVAVVIVAVVLHLNALASFNILMKFR